LNEFDRIGLYRWINDDVAGWPRIGADRSLQIREEIERICKLHFQRRILSRESIEHAEPQQRDNSVSAVTGPTIASRLRKSFKV
jgi:hypothetical protein